MPFSRTATQHWLIWGAPFGPVRKRSSALLRSLELTTASPAVVRLGNCSMRCSTSCVHAVVAANRFLTGCVLTYHVEGVPGTEKTAKDCYTSTPYPDIKHIYWVLSAAMLYKFHHLTAGIWELIRGLKTGKYGYIPYTASGFLFDTPASRLRREPVWQQ